MNIHKLALILVLLVGLSSLALAQSFNIDLDIGIGDAQGGHGAPSSGFGAAAGQTGYWNAVNAGSRDVTSLVGLDGAATNTQIQASGGVGSAGGYNFAGNTGDFALLLNDSADVGNANFYHFTGLLPGHYLIYTYAVKANIPNVGATVTVDGAVIPVQSVSGPMPGNSFILGQTHCIHDLWLAGDSFTIEVSGAGPPNPQVNGFQILAVPEPCTVSILILGAACLARQRRRRKPV